MTQRPGIRGAIENRGSRNNSTGMYTSENVARSITKLRQKATQNSRNKFWGQATPNPYAIIITDVRGTSNTTSDEHASR